MLKEFSDPYLRARSRTNTNYEDLFYLCQQIEDNENFEIDNPLLEPFIKQLHNKLVGLNIYPPIPPLNRNIDIKYLSNRAISLIQNVVWDCLSTDNTPTGLDLLIELQENVEKFDIVTLNHDLIIERILDENNISYCNGFGVAEGEIRYFNPYLYEEKNSIRLFKLHGSLNWYRFRSTENDITIDRYGMAIGKDHWHLKNKNGHFVNNLSYTPVFLTGSYNKMLDYNFGIYRILHTRFDQVLERTSRIVMSGYGWNDRGINGRLFEWLQSSIENRIILLHENPESLKEKSKSALWRKYDGLVNDRRLIPIRKWFSEVKFSDIDKYLN